jgi:hypothetical protein
MLDLTLYDFTMRCPAYVLAGQVRAEHPRHAMGLLLESADGKEFAQLVGIEADILKSVSTVPCDETVLTGRTPQGHLYSVFVKQASGQNADAAADAGGA